jgi:hypothetical protein
MNRSIQDTTGVETQRPQPDASSTSPARPRTPSRSLRHLRRGAAVAGVGLLAALVTVPAASADTRRFRDVAGDTGLPADLTTVRVSNGPETVDIAARPGRVGLEDLFVYWLDTRPRNAGPEYKVVVAPNSDDFGLLRVGAFGKRGRPVACEGLRARADHFTPEWISTSVPRSCLGNPGKVRVAVKARYTDGETSVVDWAPSKRRFFGWVAPCTGS